jgi:AcrR family transcriptional regulator
LRCRVRGIEDPLSRSKEKAGGRREELIKAAAELFEEHGYADTSVEDVAAAVGIAKATLYHYFKSRDELLFEVHSHFLRLVVERFEKRERDGLSLIERLRGVVVDTLVLMDSHPGHVRVFLEHFRDLPAPLQRRIRIRRDVYAEKVEQLFVDAVLEGTLRPLDPRLATLSLFGMSNWSYQWYRRGGSMTAEQIADVLWDYFYSGVRPSE